MEQLRRGFEDGSESGFVAETGFVDTLLGDSEMLAELSKTEKRFCLCFHDSRGGASTGDIKPLPDS